MECYIPCTCIYAIEYYSALKKEILPLVFFVVFFCLFFPFLGQLPHGGSQARGRIGAVEASLRQSHSNAGSEPHLQPTPQLTAMLDP